MRQTSRISKDQNESFEKLTNALTDIAFLLIFLIALPSLVGVLFAGIVQIFIQENFLKDPITLGVFLLGICLSIPFFFYFFLKVRKKKIWNELIPLSYDHELTMGVVLLYGPMVIASLLFYILSMILQYVYFSFEFQFVIILLMPLESLIFLKFYKIAFPTKKINSIEQITPESAEFSKTNITFQKYNNFSLQKVILKEVIIKVLFDIFCLWLSGSVIVILIFNSMGIIFYLGIKQIVFKEKKHPSDWKLITNLKNLGIMLVFQGIIQFWVCAFRSTFIPWLYVLITTLLTIKFFIIIFYKSNKNFFSEFSIPMNWNFITILNDLITILLFLSGMIYGFLEELAPFYLLLISITFLIENQLERHFNLSEKNISNLFLFIQLIIADVLLSFLIIPGSLYFQIIIFSLISISIPPLLYERKAISKKYYTFAQNILYILIFYEIGFYLSFITTINHFFITDSFVFNYIFFISLSSLGTLYRLYATNTRGSRTVIFSQIVILFLMVSFFGIFLMIENSTVQITYLIVHSIRDSDGFLVLFKPAGFLWVNKKVILTFFNNIGSLSSNSTFLLKSSDGLVSIWNILLAGLITIAGYLLIIKVHEHFSVFPNYVSKFNKFIIRLILTFLLCMNVLIIFQSISGIILAIVLGTYMSSHIYDAFYKFRDVANKSLKFSPEKAKFILLIIYLFESLVLFFFIGIEFLQIHFSLTIIAALVILLLYINKVPKIRSILTIKVKNRMVLHLINTIILFLMGIFAIPVSNYLVTDVFYLKSLNSLINCILISGLFILFSLIIAIKQLLLGNYFKVDMYKYLKIGISLSFWYYSAILICFNILYTQILSIYDFYPENFQFLLIELSIVIFFLSFIFKIIRKLRLRNRDTSITLIWRINEGFAWEIGFILLFSDLILLFTYIQIPIFNYILYVSISVILFLLITMRNILNFKQYLPDKIKMIEKIKDLLQMTINLVLTLSIFSLTALIYDLISNFYLTAILFALLLSIAIIGLIIHSSEIIHKYIPRKMYVWIDSILIFSESIVSIFYIFYVTLSSSGVNLLENYISLFILAILIIEFSSFLIISRLLIKNKILNENSWINLYLSLFDVLSILSFFGFIGVYFLHLLVSESILICFGLFWTLIYIIPIFKKFIPQKILSLLNAIFLAIFDAIFLVSLFNAFLQYNIDIFQDYFIIGLLFSLIVVFGSIIISSYQLKQGNYLSIIFYKKIHFSSNMALCYTTYAFILSLLLKILPKTDQGIVNLPIKLLSIFIPLLGLYFTFHSIDKKGFYREINVFDRIIKWQISLFWVISSLGLIATLNFIPILHHIFLLFSIFLGTFTLYYFLIRVERLLPNSHRILQFLRELLLYINIISAFLTSYFVLNEFILFIPSLSVSLSLILIVLLISQMGFYQTVDLKKILIEVVSLFYFASSIFLTIAIHNYFFIGNDFPLYAYNLILLIPLGGIYLCNYILRRNVIFKKFTYFLYQLFAFILVINIGLFSYSLSYSMLNSGVNLVLSILISSFSITGLLVIDYFSFKHLTNHNDASLSFSMAFLYNSIAISLTLAMVLYSSSKDQFIAYTFVQIPLLYGILRFIKKDIKSDMENGKEIPVLNQQDKSKQIGENPLVLSPEPNSKIESTIEAESKIEFRENKITETIKSRDTNIQTPPISRKISLSSIMHKFSQNIAIYWSSVEFGFIAFTLLINLYFIINLVVVGGQPTFIQSALLGCLLFSGSALLFTKGRSYLFYFFQTVLSVALSYLLILQIEIPSIYLIIGAIFLAIGINILTTRNIPYNNIVKYGQNILILGIYYGINQFYNIPLHWALLISSFCFDFATNRTYLNFLFRSLKAWASAYFIYEILISTFIIPISLAISSGVVIGLTWEWLICLRDKKWRYSFVLPIISYAVLASWITTYVFLFIQYTNIMGIISPPLLAVICVSLILLKKKVKIFNQEPVVDVLILSALFFSIYTLGRFYLFQSFHYSEILSISLAGAIGGFLTIFIFDYIELQVKSAWKAIILAGAPILFGIFTFFFLYDPTIKFQQPYQIALPIAVDFFILTFYIAIGIYKHSFREIWSLGVWAWLGVPIINFIMISYLITGIDNVTLALTVFNTTINGSIILSIIICSLLYLPVILTRLKKYFNKIIYAFWIELLAFTAWGAVNIFPDSLILQIPFISLIGLILLVPVYFYFKEWKPLLIIWPIVAAANIVFIELFFQFPLVWAIPVGTLIGGLYLISTGYFPNVRKSKLISTILIISGYFIILGSIFALLYSFIVLVFINVTISVNITCIVISFMFLSAKYFKMQDIPVKIAHALVIIINLAILMATSFGLIGEGEFTLFGIFLGIAFAFGATLSFQARKYLPRNFFEIIWFGMALFFGLAAFDLGLLVFGIGAWASTGVLLAITTIFFIPIIRKHLHIIFMALIAGLTLIIMQILLNVSVFVSMYQTLIFLDLLFGLELLYIYATSLTKARLFKNERKNYEFFTFTWPIFSVLISLTIVLIVDVYFILPIYSLGLIFITIFALQTLSIEKFVKNNEIFYQYSKTEKIIDGLHNGLVLTIYFAVATFIALNIPLIPEISSVFYRLVILFSVSFIESFIFDQYLIKVIKSKIRVQLDWILYLAFSFSFTMSYALYSEIWELSLILWAILFFGTIYLNQKLGKKYYLEILKLVNVLLLITGLFVYLWHLSDLSTLWNLGGLSDIQNLPALFKYSEIISDFRIYFFLNVSLNLLILYLFFKLNIIKCFSKNTSKKVMGSIYFALSVSFALFFADGVTFGLILAAYNPLLLYIGIILFLITILNFIKIKNSPLSYAFWTIISLSFASFAFELTKVVYNGDNSPFSPILWFIFLFGAFITINYYCLAQRIFVWILNRVKRDVLSEIDSIPLSQFQNINFNSSFLLSGHTDQKIAKEIYSSWFFIEIGIFSVILAQGWNFLFCNSWFAECAPTFKIILWISLFMAAFFVQLVYISTYIRNNQLSKPKLLSLFGNIKIFNILKEIAVYAFVISGFLHLWLVLNVSEHLLSMNFDRLSLNLTICVFLLYLFKRFGIIKKRGLFVITFVLSVLISITLEEYFRVYTNTDLLFNIALFLGMFVLLNSRNIKSSLLAYGYWISISFSTSALLFEFIRYLNRKPFALSSSLLIFFSIFESLFTIFAYLLAERQFSKKPKEKPALFEYLSTEKGYLENNPKTVDNEDLSPENPPIVQDSKNKTSILLIGHKNQSFARKIFIINATIVLIIASILLERLWMWIYIQKGIVFNSISILHRDFLHLILLLLLLSIGMEKVFKYIRSNTLWFEYPKIKRFVTNLRNINAIILYFSIPLTIAGNLYQIILESSGLEYALLSDGAIFLALVYVSLYLLDVKLFHILGQNLSKSLIFGIFNLLIANFAGLIFYYIINSYNLAIAVIIILGILHFTLELETRPKILSKITGSSQITNFTQVIGTIRKISWVILSISLGLFISIYPNVTISPIRIICGIIYLTLTMFYENWMIFKAKTPIYFKLKIILGLMVYLETFTLCAFILIPLNIAILITEKNPIIFIRSLIILELVAIVYVINVFDKYIFHFFPAKYSRTIDFTLFISTLVSGVFDLAYFMIIRVDFQSILPSELPQNLLSQIMIPMMIISVIVAVVLIIRFKKRIVNQIIYIVLFFELFVYLLGLNNYSILISSSIIILVLYPFIFFMEKMLLLLQKLGKWILGALIAIKHFIVRVWKVMVLFYHNHKRIVYSGLGLILGVGAYFILENLFLSGLIFLIVYYPVSPEREKVTSPKIFSLKILYRTLVVVCLIGTANKIIPPTPWIYTLFILVFLGYVIIVVRRSEELYHLPIYWRFISSLSAIIDFLVTVFLALRFYSVI